MSNPVSFLPSLLAFALLAACADQSPSSEHPGTASPGTPRIVPVTSNSSAHCTGPDVRALELPVFPNQGPGSPKFTYSFKLRRSQNPNAPVIIYLPGGPGEASMTDDLELGASDEGELLSMVGRYLRKVQPWMDSFHYVFTDLRGSGCNSYPEQDLPDEAIRAEYAAEDVLAVIDYLRDPSRSGIPPGPYIIYGKFYGTVLATILGSRIEISGRPIPAGIVLEETVGTINEMRATQLNARVTQVWNSEKGHLPPEVATELESEDPFGLPGSDWDDYLTASLMFGKTRLGDAAGELGHGGTWRSLLEIFSRSLGDPSLLDQLRQAGQDFMNRLNEIKETRAFKNIAGPELGMYERAATPAQAETSSDRLYDASKYQLKTPLYYFHGSWDTHCLLEDATHHFEQQRNAHRIFVNFLEGGTAPLSHELNFVMGDIFRMIAHQQPKQISDFLKNLIENGVPIVRSVLEPSSN